VGAIGLPVLDLPVATEAAYREPILKGDTHRSKSFGLTAVEADSWLRVSMTVATFT
jgi:hypothetical protein